MEPRSAAHYRFNVGPGQSATVRLRLISKAYAGKALQTPLERSPSGKILRRSCSARRQEADEFYRISDAAVSVSDDGANVMRQAIAGMLWSKQYYYLDADQWLEEHGTLIPFIRGSRDFRNRRMVSHDQRGHHLDAGQMGVPMVCGLGSGVPHAAALDCGSRLRQRAAGPDASRTSTCTRAARCPAYEWNFSDVNPPVHAWATLFLHRTEQALHGEG